jgi:hypothetical protein
VVLSHDYLAGKQEPLAQSHFQLHFLSIIMNIQVFIPNFTNICTLLLSIDLELVGEGNEKLRIHGRRLRFPLQSRRHSSTKQRHTALAWLSFVMCSTFFAATTSIRPRSPVLPIPLFCLYCQGNRRGVGGRGKKWESTDHRRSSCKVHHYLARRHA